MSTPAVHTRRRLAADVAGPPLHAPRAPLRAAEQQQQQQQQAWTLACA
jgi:hypothetical protein